MSTLTLDPDSPASNARLETACAGGDVEAVATLLRSDVDVNDVSRGASALAHACKHGHLQVVQMLLQFGATDPNVGVVKSSSSPSVVAASLGHSEVLQALIAQRRVDVNKARRDGVTPLIIAVQQSHRGCIAALCSCPRLKVNARALFPERISALHIAVRANDLESVRMLLSHPAMDLAENAYMRETPLHISSQFGDSHSAISDLLRAYESGIDPLFHAAPDVTHATYAMPNGLQPEEVDTAEDANETVLPPREGYTSKPAEHISDCPHLQAVQHELRNALGSPSGLGISELSVLGLRINDPPHGEAHLSVNASLSAGLDFTGPTFALNMYSIMVLAGWALTSVWLEKRAGTKVDISVQSSSVTHSKARQIEALFIECNVISSGRTDQLPTEGVFGGKVESGADACVWVQAKCEATDNYGGHVASLDVCFNVLRDKKMQQEASPWPKMSAGSRQD